MAIAMNPRTGEIYAMANVTDKGFHGWAVQDPEADKNRCVTDVYEPGSIFKLVTISGALADGTITPSEKFVLPPSIHVADREVNEASRSRAARSSGTPRRSCRTRAMWAPSRSA